MSIIEILVIIAIIAILLSILMPVLTTSRALSKRAKCASNLRQLGSAFHQYISDWNGVYPAPGGKVGDFNYWSQSGTGGLVRYVGNNGGVGTVWCCPELTEWQGRYAARTYSMNSYLRNPPDVDYPGCISIPDGAKETMIEFPRRTILLYEGLPVTPSWPDTDDYIYRCGNWECVRGWWTRKNARQHTIGSWIPWHGGRNNYLYCDGHIKCFRPNQYPNHPPYDLRNEWWVRKTVMTEKMKRFR